jgi:hypothetical protein
MNKAKINGEVYDIEVDGNYTYYKKDGIVRFRHYKDSDVLQAWREYDNKGNLIHYKDSNGFEHWYDSEGNEIEIPIVKPFTFN